MSEHPIDHGPDRASDLRTEIVKILGYSEWHQANNPAAKIAVLHADLIAKLVERHQAEDAKALNAAMDWLALAPKDDAPIQFSELVLMMMRQEHAAAIQRAREQGEKP